jgi:two-component system response regulator YesN
MMSDQLNREISIVYDLLFGYTDKMKNLREGLDIGDFRLPVDTALVIKANNYSLLTSDKSEFRKEELQQDILNIINGVASNNSSDLLSALIEEDMFVLFFSTRFASEGKSDILEYARVIKNRLEENTSFEYSLGIGRSYDNLKGLIFSYKEAMNVCKSCYFQQNKDVMYIDQMVEFKKDVPIFITEMETKLIDKIQSGNLDNIEFVFQEIINSMTEEKLEPEAIKIRVLDLIYRVIEEVEKVTDDSRESLYELFSWIRKILQMETQKEMNRIIYNLSDKLFDILRRYRKGSNTRHSINQALNYIEENYSKDLSLKKVSDEVGLSLYYFSHLFKEEIGESFVTYLNKLRIRKSKLLLINSNFNIAEIAYKVGYNDQNYFTRVFKDYEDLTPSEFRIQNQGLSAL